MLPMIWAPALLQQRGFRAQHLELCPKDKNSLSTEGVGRSSTYTPPRVDRIWLWLYYNEIPIYPTFYLSKGTTICILLCIACPSRHVQHIMKQ